MRPTTGLHAVQPEDLREKPRRVVGRRNKAGHLWSFISQPFFPCCASLHRQRATSAAPRTCSLKDCVPFAVKDFAPFANKPVLLVLLVQVAGAGFDFIKEVAKCNLRRMHRNMKGRRRKCMFSGKGAVEQGSLARDGMSVPRTCFALRSTSSRRARACGSISVMDEKGERAKGLRHPWGRRQRFQAAAAF